MLKKLKKWLNENNIEYKIFYGGTNKDIENIEVGEYSIIEDSGKYMICHVPTANFMWLIFQEVTSMIVKHRV